jgi:hypothetical protein
MWLFVAISTGVLAGLFAMVCLKVAPGFVVKRRYWIPLGTASALWLVSGAIAQYGFRTTPWGWFGSWSNTLLASTGWLGIAELVSICIFSSQRDAGNSQKKA